MLKLEDLLKSNIEEMYDLLVNEIENLKYDRSELYNQKPLGIIGIVMNGFKQKKFDVSNCKSIFVTQILSESKLNELWKEIHLRGDWAFCLYDPLRIINSLENVIEDINSTLIREKTNLSNTLDKEYIQYRIIKTLIRKGYCDVVSLEDEKIKKILDNLYS